MPKFCSQNRSYSRPSESKFETRFENGKVELNGIHRDQPQSYQYLTLPAWGLKNLKISFTGLKNFDRSIHLTLNKSIEKYYTHYKSFPSVIQYKQDFDVKTMFPKIYVCCNSHHSRQKLNTKYPNITDRMMKGNQNHR